MTHNKEVGQGLQGRDNQQEGLRDERGGAFDNGGISRAPDKTEAQRTAHQRAQHGADVRQGVSDAETRASKESDLPEGLKRTRKGSHHGSAG
jgi:hypothetical protein